MVSLQSCPFTHTHTTVTIHHHSSFLSTTDWLTLFFSFATALDESRPLLWRDLAKAVPGRSNKDCRRRWWNSLAEGTAKGLWSEEEDDLLMRAVQQHGPNWRHVAQQVGTRTPDQCSSHWTQVLDPDINHCDWTAKEVSLCGWLFFSPSPPSLIYLAVLSFTNALRARMKTFCTRC